MPKNSLSLSTQEVEERIGRGDDYVVRFKTPVAEVRFMMRLEDGSFFNAMNLAIKSNEKRWASNLSLS